MGPVIYRRNPEHTTIDSPFGVITGPTAPAEIRYYQEDELGNVIGYSAGPTVAMKVSYDSWGVRNVELANYNRLNWKGLIWEGEEVGLYYMRNRWYDPETGRFMSEDPIGHAGGINLYAFANNDPINGIDPSGLACKRLAGHQTSYNVGMEVFIVWHPGDWVCPEQSRRGDPDSEAGSWGSAGSGPSGAAALQALRAVWPAFKTRLTNSGNCYAGVLSAAGFGAQTRAARAGLRSVGASVGAHTAGNAAHRYAMGNMFRSKPAWTALQRAAAADATAFGEIRNAQARAAGAAYIPEALTTAGAQSITRDIDLVEFIPIVGAVYGSRHLRSCVK